MSYIKNVRRLRAMFFGHTLVDAAGCSATAQGISRWGGAWWASRTGQEIPDTLNHKWPGYLTGSFPRSRLRATLIEDFPILRAVLDDPLWPLLQRLVHPKEDTSCWAAQLRLNGRSFKYYSVARLQRLCGAPHWRRLSGLIALLGSERLADRVWQAWLRRTFTAYLLCVCLDLPGQLDPVAIYDVLEEANRQGKLGPLADWPASAAGFRQRLRRLHRIRRRLQNRGWIREWRADDRLLFWRVLQERAWLLRLLTSQPASDFNRRDKLSKQVRPWIRQAQRDCVSFEAAAPGTWGWCDPTRGGSPPFPWAMLWA
ncbi:hypothetical protein CP336_13880 [Pseudomonas fluorescens]|nr:hypothetical protein CP336_13880 [Pseudomonas fluorescens]